MRAPLMIRAFAGAFAALLLATAPHAFAQQFSGGGAALTGAPVVTVETSGTGTYTTPTDQYGNIAKYLDVELDGPGGPGSGGGPGAGNGTVSASDTTFGAWTAGHGAAASGLTGGLPGMCSGTGIISDPVQQGGGGSNGYQNAPGGMGGGGGLALEGSGATPAPPVNSGFGGAGGAPQGSASPGAGGGQGARCHVIIFNPPASESFNVGPASTGGALGTSGAAGAGGASGRIVEKAFFQ